MSATRTRQESRERILKTVLEVLDQIIPADESVPLKGATFRDFEMQARTFKEAVIPTLLEERACLDERAAVGRAGRCPHCGLERTYLDKEPVKKEIRSPDGPVVLERQQARCRACDGSFSPSGS